MLYIKLVCKAKGQVQKVVRANGGSLNSGLDRERKDLSWECGQQQYATRTVTITLTHIEILVCYWHRLLTNGYHSYR